MAVNDDDVMVWWRDAHDARAQLFAVSGVRHVEARMSAQDVGQAAAVSCRNVDDSQHRLGRVRGKLLYERSKCLDTTG